MGRRVRVIGRDDLHTTGGYPISASDPLLPMIHSILLLQCFLHVPKETSGDALVLTNETWRLGLCLLTYFQPWSLTNGRFDWLIDFSRSLRVDMSGHLRRELCFV